MFTKQKLMLDLEENNWVVWQRTIQYGSLHMDYYRIRILPRFSQKGYQIYLS